MWGIIVVGIIEKRLYMKTSDLIKITSARNVPAIVKYNTKSTKTIGHWQHQQENLKRNNLVSYTGYFNQPTLSLHQQGLIFSHQAMQNAILSNLNRHRLTSYTSIPKNYSLCHTIVQSFDYHANPDLTPHKVHRMGLQMMVGLKSYFKTKYDYTLDGGLVSTHIDDDHPKLIRGKIHHTHLHNHIIILSYNNQGKSISPYIRKADVYSFHHINDNICMHNNLKDYYFLKLQKEINPSSSFTQHRPVHSKSHLQHAIDIFTKCNNIAYDYYPTNFKKAHQLRNHELTFSYQFRTRSKKDTKTHRMHTQFTLKGMVSRNQKIQWYNLTNLRLLLWRNKKEERCERLIKQINISQISNIPITYQQFQTDLQATIQHIPPIEQINSKDMRKRYNVPAQVPKNQKQSRHYHKEHETANSYIKYLIFNSKWSSIKQTGKNDYNINQIYQNLEKNNDIYFSKYATTNDNSGKTINRNQRHNRNKNVQHHRGPQI